MKQAIWVLACFLSIVACANAKQDMGKFIATLPNGITVELVGMSYHDPGDELSEPRRWWKPDGSDLPNEPYRKPHRYSTGGADYYIREFAIRVIGAEIYSSTAFSSLGRSSTWPGIPRDEKGNPLPVLRSFICKFKKNQDKDTIRIGISIEPWQKVEEWEHSWQRFEPEQIVINSKKPLVFTWPRREKRGAVIVEITHRYIGEATRLLLFDRNGNMHERTESVHGEGAGLMKHLYWFWKIKLEDMQRFEFQKRPYQWIEFLNVSLEPGKKTNVQVAVITDQNYAAQLAGDDIGKPPVPKEPLWLVGRPLPELEELRIKLSSADVSDKMILVCFWDMQQRPSRNCIMRLAKQAQQLKQKGVTVVAVQASKIDEKALNEWIKKYNIPFTVGAITTDIEKTRFTWGVRSLPWLILTGREHIVRAEDFSLAELDEKISANTQK